MTPRELSREHALQLLGKADQDRKLLDAIVENRAIADEVFGFHCQQAAEKLIKAVLAAAGVAYRRVHDLEALFQMLEDTDALDRRPRPDPSRPRHPRLL